MLDFKDRRVIAAVGAGLAVAAGLVVAAVMVSRHGPDSSEAPPASQGGLVVQTGRDDDVKLDPARPLHCFVDGKLIGDLPLSVCAKRNGVAAGALDVGLDPSGSLAASSGDTPLTPLPPSTTAAPVPETASPTDAAENSMADATACWRHNGVAWRKLVAAMSLEACVQTLFAGRCLPSDAQPSYGRWGGNMLRLVPGEVEISDDDRTFRDLVEQAPDCSFPPVSSAQ